MTHVTNLTGEALQEEERETTLKEVQERGTYGQKIAGWIVQDAHITKFYPASVIYGIYIYIYKCEKGM